MITSAPQIREYLEMGGPLAGISEEGWGDMATSFDDVKRTCWKGYFHRLSKSTYSAVSEDEVKAMDFWPWLAAVVTTWPAE